MKMKKVIYNFKKILLLSIIPLVMSGCNQYLISTPDKEINIKNGVIKNLNVTNSWLVQNYKLNKTAKVVLQKEVLKMVEDEKTLHQGNFISELHAKPNFKFNYYVGQTNFKLINNSIMINYDNFNFIEKYLYEENLGKLEKKLVKERMQKNKLLKGINLDKVNVSINYKVEFHVNEHPNVVEENLVNAGVLKKSINCLDYEDFESDITILDVESNIKKLKKKFVIKNFRIFGEENGTTLILDVITNLDLSLKKEVYSTSDFINNMKQLVLGKDIYNYKNKLTHSHIKNNLTCEQQNNIKIYKMIEKNYKNINTSTLSKLIYFNPLYDNIN
jgi:hypothetical protein